MFVISYISESAINICIALVTSSEIYEDTSRITSLQTGSRRTVRMVELTRTQKTGHCVDAALNCMHDSQNSCEFLFHCASIDL